MSNRFYGYFLVLYTSIYGKSQNEPFISLNWKFRWLTNHYTSDVVVSVEISSSKRKHHVVIYPVAPDALSDPRLLKIFDICTEVHVDLHNICSDVAGNSRMAGYVHLKSFKSLSVLS